MDLDDPNFFSTPDTIAKWDGFLYYDLFAPLFDCFWRLPNGKILVSSRVATPFLHYIHEPNRPGDQCMFEQRAIMLPVDPLNEPFGVFITALPNFPPFRMPPLDTLCITSTTDIFDSKIINVYPNPVIDIFSITCTAVIHDITVFDLNGIPVMSSMVSGNQDHYEFSLEDWPSGIYFVVCRDSNKKIVGTKKLVKI